jgi:hypothetical protein
MENIALYIGGSGLVIAFLLLVVVWRHYRLHDAAIMLGIYEKRAVVYKAVIRMLNNMVEKQYSPRAVREFLLDSSDSIYVFNSEISDYIQEIAHNAMSLYESRLVLSSPNLNVVSTVMQKHENEVQRIEMWVAAQYPIAKQLFSKHIEPVSTDVA